MHKPFRGKVIGGRFKPVDLDGFKAEFAKHEGKYVEVVIKKPEKVRSKPQNRYYYGVVIPLMSEATGYTKEEIHEALKIKFLTDMTGDLPKVRSTTSLSTVEFSEYVANIQRFAGEYLDTYIPDPNQVDY